MEEDKFKGLNTKFHKALEKIQKLLDETPEDQIVDEISDMLYGSIYAMVSFNLKSSNGIDDLKKYINDIVDLSAKIIEKK